MGGWENLLGGVRRKDLWEVKYTPAGFELFQQALQHICQGGGAHLRGGILTQTYIWHTSHHQRPSECVSSSFQIRTG